MNNREAMKIGQIEITNKASAGGREQHEGGIGIARGAVQPRALQRSHTRPQRKGAKDDSANGGGHVNRDQGCELHVKASVPSVSPLVSFPNPPQTCSWRSFTVVKNQFQKRLPRISKIQHWRPDPIQDAGWCARSGH